MTDNTLVARALDRLAKGSMEFTTQYLGGYTGFKQLEAQTAALIRAVDEPYPEGYDEAGGFTVFGVWGQPEHLKCRDCFGRDEIGHADNCHSWHTRVALLALCRDILGEKG